MGGGSNVITVSEDQPSAEGQISTLAKAISRHFTDENGKEVHIRIDQSRQLICASDMCKVNPKKTWSGYIRSRGSKEFIKELSELLQICRSSLIISDNLGKMSERGTWVHIKIAMDLARWISPRFALFMYDIFGRYFSGDFSLINEIAQNRDSLNETKTSFESRTDPSSGKRITVVNSIPDEELAKNPRKKAKETIRFKKLESKFLKLQAQNQTLKIELEETQTGFFEVSNERDDLLERIEEIRKENLENQERISREHKSHVDKIQEENRAQLAKLEGYAEYTVDKAKKLGKKLDKVLPDHVSLADTPEGEVTQLWIMRDHGVSPDEDDYNLYPIRGQLKSMNSRIKELKKAWGENIKPYYKIRQPNAIAFWRSFKKAHSKNIVKCSDSAWFKLKGITRREFIKKIKQEDRKRTSKF